MSAIEEAGAWYSQLLGATEKALSDVGLPLQAAAPLIAAFAREGYMIDADPSFAGAVVVGEQEGTANP